MAKSVAHARTEAAVEGLGFRGLEVWGLGFRVFGFRVWGLGCGVQG